jgi:HSP20 family protein
MPETNGLTNAPAPNKTEAAQAEQTRGGPHYVPRVDIFEDDKELTIFADMPGVRAEDVELRYENGELLVRGRVRRGVGPDRPYLLREYEPGDFYRAFSIHESVDAGRISAEHKGGVLTVHLPKVEAARPRKIAVRGE